MKFFDKKRVRFLILISIISLGLTSYLIYEQTGKFGKIEIISISITALFVVLIVYYVIKIGNK
jgi:hypothetical protein